MLSGMNVKPAAVTAVDIEAFVAAGHAVTVLKPRKVKRHWLRTKSHLVGIGYAAGGNKLRTSKVAA
tara:strand:- start:129 stop:326 length:198 start_codon:yes stop_codon:yes gene_type:complete